MPWIVHVLTCVLLRVHSSPCCAIWRISLIEGRGNWLHPTDSLRWNDLSLHWKPASGTTLLICFSSSYNNDIYRLDTGHRSTTYGWHGCSVRPNEWMSVSQKQTFISECQAHKFKLSVSQFYIKLLSNQYRKSHCGYKMVVRASYFYNGNSFASKTEFLLLNQPQRNHCFILALFVWMFEHALSFIGGMLINDKWIMNNNVQQDWSWQAVIKISIRAEPILFWFMNTSVNMTLAVGHFVVVDAA